MVKFRGFKRLNIGKVVGNIAGVLVALYGGGVVMSALGTAMNATCSGFYTGLSLIGWTVGTGDAGATGCVGNTHTILETNDGGILAIVGIFGLMKVINQFIRF